MNEADVVSAHADPRIAAAVSGSALARPFADGAPGFALALAPLALIHFDPRLRSLLGVRDGAAFLAMIESAGTAGARRLRQLTQGHDFPAKIETLRFAGVEGRERAATLLLRKTTGPAGAFLLGVTAMPFDAETVAAAGEAGVHPPVPATVAATAPTPDGGHGAKRRRLLWRTDRDGRFEFVSPDATEEDGAPRVGESVADYAKRIGAGSALLAAIDARDSFVDAPVGAIGGRHLSFAGAPRRTATLGFAGFTGFVLAAPTLTEKTRAENAGAGIAAASSFEVAPSVDPRETVLARRESEGAETVVPVEPAPIAIGAAPPAADGVSTSNVVPLRPGFGAANQNGPGAFVDLDPNERNAFREIARALGARSSDDHAPPARLGDGLAEAAAATPHGSHEAAPTTPHGSQEAAATMPHGSQDDQDAAAWPDSPPIFAPAAIFPPPSAKPEAGDAPALRAAVDRLPVGVVVHREGAPLYANRTALDLLGFADLGAFAAAGGLRPVLSPADEGLADRDCGHPVTLRAADGEVIPAQARSQTFEWSDGPATLLSLHRPAPALAGRGAEAAAFDLAGEGLALLDSDGRVLALNASAEAAFGFAQNEIAGESFLALLRADAHAAFRSRIEAARAGARTATPLEASLRAAGGRTATARLVVGALPSGGDARFAVAIRDETEARRTDREREVALRSAEAASAEKSRFLARMSHEIRTPLNAIVGFAELMIDGRFGEIGNERYRDYLRDIHASAGHVVSLVNDLLDLAKIEAGRSDLKPVAVDLVALAREAASLMQGEAARARVVLRLSCPSRPLRVVADERSLRQILLNLLSNALKFTGAGGQVILSVARGDSGGSALRVRDTGEGMDETGLVAALEPFGQVDPGRGGGTGLGLPLTKAMAEANRARFSLTSSKGEGTLAEVLFPAALTLME